MQGPEGTHPAAEHPPQENGDENKDQREKEGLCHRMCERIVVVEMRDQNRERISRDNRACHSPWTQSWRKRKRISEERLPVKPSEDSACLEFAIISTGSFF